MELIDYLKTLNITEENCSIELLRSILVDEWTLNKENYQHFLKIQ